MNKILNYEQFLREEYLTPLEKILYEHGVDSLEDFQISFFDDPETKEKKRKIQASFTEQEWKIIHKSLAEMEEIGGEQFLREEYLSPLERILYEHGVDSLEDFQISFFDDPETKEKKRKIQEGFSEKEWEIINKSLAEMEEIFQISEEQQMDWIPSFSSDVDNYDDGGNELMKVTLQYENVVPNMLEYQESCQDITSVEQFYPSQEIQFRRGDFWYSEGELLYQNKEMQKPHVIGNFWINIIEEVNNLTEICNDQNIAVDYQTETTWKLQIFCMGQEFETEQDVKSLWSDAKVLKCTRDRAYLENDQDSKRLYRKYINLSIELGEYPSVYLYQSTGWTNVKGIGWVYLTDRGIIGFEDRRVRANVPYHFEYDPNRAYTIQNFRDFWGMREICRKNEVSTFLMHFSCVAVMTTLFQLSGRPVNFIVALIGATNSQKTAVGSVFSRLFDRSSMSSSDIRFNSTEVAIMEKMEKYGDAILMVDDFVPYASTQNAYEQQKKLETIIRSYGDREPRKRSQIYAKINGVPEYSPIKGCCLMTGEIFRTESVSSDTRVIQIPFERGSVDLEKLSYYQENAMIYPSFFVGFIGFLQKNVSGVMQVIMEEVRSIRGDHPAEISTPRFVDALAILSAEIKIFYAYAVQNGYITQQEAEWYRAKDAELVEMVIADNEKNVKTKTPGTEICLALKWGLKFEKLKLLSKENLGDLDKYEGAVGEDDDFYFILPDTLWKVYKEYTHETNTQIRYRSGRELNLPLKHESLILLKEEGQNHQLRSTHKLGNFTGKRFFYIYKDKFNELCNLYEQF